MIAGIGIDLFPLASPLTMREKEEFLRQVLPRRRTLEGPRVRLTGRIREPAEQHSVARIHVSHSSSKHHAVAVLLLETNKPEVIP